MKTLKTLGACALFIGSIGLVVAGQRSIGIGGLCVMLAGLAGLLVLLYLYNRRYQ